MHIHTVLLQANPVDVEISKSTFKLRATCRRNLTAKYSSLLEIREWKPAKFIVEEKSSEGKYLIVSKMHRLWTSFLLLEGHSAEIYRRFAKTLSKRALDENVVR